MLFIRRGARNIFIRSNDIGRVADCISSKLGGKTVSFEEGWTEVREFQSIVFITPPGLSRTRVADAEQIVMVPCESSQLLVELFDKSCRDTVDTVQLGPGTILIRVVGDGAVLEDEFVEKYGARSMPLDEAISEGEIEDTVLIITNSSLSKSISLQEFTRLPLLVHQPTPELYWDLRSQGAHLITQSLEDKQWYEMRINIFDAAEHYDVHYERLQTVLSDLDIGMILGEMWTKDHALALMSVLAYQVRLFTLEPPAQMKRILMGMEYSRQGRRFVDMDLYYRNRKVGKNDKNVRRTRTENRIELRDELYRRLSKDALAYLHELERPIEKESG